jgi:tetratricopeptide (TPR) repeat protein
MRIDIRKANLDHLQRQYFYGTTAVIAAQMMEGGKQQAVQSGLAQLLGSHKEPVAKEGEIHLRNALDELLGFYSLVEIACLIRFVPHPLPEEFGQKALAFLGDRDIRHYYEEDYPLLLTRLLRQRLTGEQDMHYPARPATAALFMELLDTNRLLEGDQEVETFLWLLDVRQPGIGQYSFRSVIEVLAEPREFMARFARESSEQDALDRSLHGLRKLLVFCTEFDALLQRARDYPVLQSAFWHYHSYWFQTIGQELRRGLEVALDQIHGWGTAVEERTVAEVGSLESVGAVIRQLTSPQYREELEQAASARWMGRLPIHEQPASAPMALAWRVAWGSGMLATVLVLALLIIQFDGWPAWNRLRARDLLKKGVASFASGNYEDAVEKFKRANDLDPQLMQARFYLATAYASQYIPGDPSQENANRGKQAIYEYQEVLRKDPSNLNAMDGLGSILFQIAGQPYDPKKFEESKSYYQKHIQLKPTDPEPYYWVGVIDWTQSFRANTEMRADYNKNNIKKQVKDTDPLPAGVREQYAEKYGPLVDEGITALQKATQLREDYDDAFAYLNLLYRRKADVVGSELERADLLKQADSLVDKLKQIKEKKIQTPAVS